LAIDAYSRTKALSFSEIRPVASATASFFD
jgi:hypothetical protein